MLKLKLQYLGHLMRRADSFEKTLILGKIVTEDEMVRQHHQLSKHESEQTLGVGDRQGGLECCSPWGHRESDMPELLNNDNKGAYLPCVRPQYWDA